MRSWLAMPRKMQNVSAIVKGVARSLPKRNAKHTGRAYVRPRQNAKLRNPEAATSIIGLVFCRSRAPDLRGLNPKAQAPQIWELSGKLLRSAGARPRVEFLQLLKAFDRLHARTLVFVHDSLYTFRNA